MKEARNRHLYVRQWERTELSMAPGLGVVPRLFPRAGWVGALARGVCESVCMCVSV